MLTKFEVKNKYPVSKQFKVKGQKIKITSRQQKICNGL